MASFSPLMYSILKSLSQKMENKKNMDRRLRRKKKKKMRTMRCLLILLLPIFAQSFRTSIRKRTTSNGSCNIPVWPAVLKYEVPKPNAKTSAIRGYGYEGNTRDVCDDLVRVSNTCCGVAPADVVDPDQISAFYKVQCPCQRCARAGIVYSKEKAEMIAIVRATDKVLAVCKNAKVCVGGFSQTDRFRFFDTRDGYGPCRNWVGGSEDKCELEVYTDVSKTRSGWHVDVRVTIGEQSWGFPVTGLLKMDREFQYKGEIDLKRSNARTLERQAKSAPQNVFLVARDHEDVFSYDISCVEAGRGYSVSSGIPSMPKHVKRKRKIPNDQRDLNATSIVPVSPQDALIAARKEAGMYEEPKKKVPQNNSTNAKKNSSWTGGGVEGAISEMAKSQSKVADAMNQVSMQMASLGSSIKKALNVKDDVKK